MSSSFLILAGTFSGTISTLNFTTSPYSLSFVANTSIGEAPSWLLGNPTNSSIFYATDETDIGAINSFTVDHVTGQVTPVSSIATQGGSPTHLGLVRNGSQIGAANYGGNSAFFASLSEDQLHFSSPQLVLFNETVSKSNPHEIVAFNDQVLVSDLGADRVWRLVQDASSTWAVQDYIEQPTGSGPRHIVVDDGSLYVLHETANTLTQQSISTSSTAAQPSTIAEISIIPSNTPDGVTFQFHAGELLFAQSPSPLLYASNRDDPDDNDTIAVVELNPLNKTDVGTGLQHLRGVAFIGENDAYLIAGGMNGGGIKVYERVSASEGYLKEVASLPAGMVSQPSSFIWVPPQDTTDSTTNPTSGTMTTSILPTQSQSGARRRHRFGI